MSLQRFRIKFPAPSVEESYQKIKRTHTKTFCKLLLVIAIAIDIFAIIQSIQFKSFGTIARMSAICILLALLMKFGHKFEKYIDFLWAILSFGLYVGSMYEIKNFLTKIECLGLYYTGFVFGIFERIIILELPRFELKILFSLGAMVARLIIFPTSSFESLTSQAVLIITGLTVDIWKEKDDRALFKSFYDYREELTKFRTLMVSGLPTNIIILTKDLKEKLFVNEYFQSTFKSIENPKVIPLNPHGWLSKFTLEKESLTAASKEIFGEELNGDMTMLQVFKILNDKRQLENQDNHFSFNVQFKNVKKESDRKIFEIKIFPLIWEGKDSLSITLSDVTQQYTNLSLRIADTNKDRMLAMVSHELRTPLNGILGMVAIMEKQIKDPEIHSYLTVCKNSGKLLLNLVNSILDLGQIRNNKFKLMISRVDLQALLQEIFYLFEFQFRAKGLYLKMDILSNVARFITTDLNRLKQVLINLIGNALKFTFTGGVEIFVRNDERSREYVEFKVSDTGVGIEEKNKDNLFKMYGRIEQNDVKINSEGVGLGLTISNHLVHLLSNNERTDGIKVESEPGKGTTFSFSVKMHMFDVDVEECDLGKTEGKEHSYDLEDSNEVEIDMDSRRSHYVPNMSNFFSQTPLPLTKKLTLRGLNCSRVSDSEFASPKIDFSKDFSGPLSQSSIFPAQDDDILIKKSREKGMVLLVDDSPFNLMVAQHVIETLGYNVKTAMNGKIAVDMVKEFASNDHAIRMIFMDCQMPVMDGYEATIALRKLMVKHEVPEIPIVALSANDSEGDKEKCRQVGMKSHLSKPVNEKSLREVLDKYCR